MLESIAVDGFGGRAFHIGGVGLFCPAGIGKSGLSGGNGGEVPGFRARDHIQDRKSIKLMSRAVQLGVSAALQATSNDAQIETHAPTRRGMFVGARAQTGDPEDLRRAFDVSSDAAGNFALSKFAKDGIDRIHPLWLVKGLSNNVLGLTASALNIQGVNSNYCQSEHGGWLAILEAAHAVAEGRVDWALAGGSDALVGAEKMLNQKLCGEAGAFVVLRSGAVKGPSVRLEKASLDIDIGNLGYLGAATWSVGFVRHILRIRSGI